MGSLTLTMKLILSLLVFTILSQTLCSVIPVRNLIKREALPEAAPHRRHYSHNQPTYSHNNYNSGYNHGYNNYNSGYSYGHNAGYNGYNNRPGVDVGKLLALKAAAGLGVVKGVKLAALLG